MNNRERKISHQSLSLPDRHEMSDAEIRQAAQDFRDFMRKRHTERHDSDRPVPRAII